MSSLLVLAGCASAPPHATPAHAGPSAGPARLATASTASHSDMQTRSDRYVVVAVANPLQRVPGRAGTSLSSYGATPRYTQGQQAAQVLAGVARRHGLREAAAWPIPALGVQCVVFEIAPGASREQVLADLARDSDVQLAQPLQDFELHASEAAAPRYNDPYLPMQHGLLALGVPQAHRHSTGRGAHVAVVDTGAQTDHPDLRGRAIRLENLVDDTAPAGGTSPATWAERHGTEVVGLIAATANNAQGIVGVAPDARISLYRACWSGTGPGAARCNSYTLAKALVAVLASDARIVNLSLGGPEDPLLGLLLAQLLQQGRTVVAALPQDGRRRGFPSAVPGVIAVASTGQPLAGDTQALRAPGQDVLTLQPGGRYDFASGSSMAAAQVSGLAALLLAMQPSLAHSDIEALLQGEDHGSAERLLTRAKAQPARQARR